ncbi:MAG: ligase-associated DNA damage response endonuclease PdeM [Burkholderiaceae bacterium]
MRVRLGDESLTLLAARAALWVARRWLIVADAHFGKAATFRARGVPVPHGTTLETLMRLDAAIDATQPTTVVVVGDLFHAAEAHAQATLSALRAWRRSRAALDIVLVEGNHDLKAGAPPADLGIRIEREPWCVDGLAFCHHPQFVRGGHVVAGHLHPAVRISGRADDGVRLPCFWLRDGLTVLPAFGSFTGGARIDREDGDRVVAVGDDRLYEIPPLRSAA